MDWTEHNHINWNSESHKKNQASHSITWELVKRKREWSRKGGHVCGRELEEWEKVKREEWDKCDLSMHAWKFPNKTLCCL